MSIKTCNLSRSILYRATSLEYYKYGLSSVGSRKASGRFNEYDISAIYLSFDVATAIAEYYQGSPPTPAVILPVEVEGTGLVDLRGRIGRWPTHWRDWRCDWELGRDLMLAGKTNLPPNSWKCGKDTRDRNLPGIIFPSTKHSGGTNIVIFPEHLIVGTLYYKICDPKGEIIHANPASKT